MQRTPSFNHLPTKWGREVHIVPISASPLDGKVDKRWFVNPVFDQVPHLWFDVGGFIFFGSLAAFVFPSTPAIMYNNLAFSIIDVLFNLAGPATVMTFITTANNIVNIFGEALGLKAGLGIGFLILTWVSFGLAPLTNLYVLAVWFFQFRAISVKVQRRSSQDMGNWKGIGSGIGPEASDNTITRPVRRNTIIRNNSDETIMSTGYRNTNTLRNSPSGRNSNGYADF